MPVSSLQSLIIGLVTAVVSLLVGLAIMSPSEGGTIVAYAGTIIGAVFGIANSIIHHGVTSARGRDASL